MRCIISHESAYWYWYNSGPDVLASAQHANSASIEGAASTASQLKRFDLSHLKDRLLPPSKLQAPEGGDTADAPCHILVPPGADGHPLRSFTRHQWRGQVPEGSLLMVGQGIAACSPELSLVQLADTLGSVELVRYAMALCASYRVGENGIEESQPLTSVQRVADMTHGCPGRRGAKRCRQLLRFVRDGARSPKEVELHLLLALPADMGGYGLGNAVLNWRIELSEDVAPMADRPDRRWVEVDVAWPGAGVGVEYQGRGHDATVCADRRRLNLLQGLGMRMVQVDREQVTDPARFDATARVVARLLGKEVPKPTDEWLAKRGALRQTLLGQGHVRM